MDRGSHDLYKLHPVSIPQHLSGHPLASACIVPEYEYMILSKDQRTYLKVHQHQLRDFLDTHYGYIYPTQGAIYTSAGRKECKIEMLINPRKESLSV